MAERNIGFVKRDSISDAGSTASQGVMARFTFRIGLPLQLYANTSSKVSPFLLTYGRHPLSPIDACCRGMGSNKRNSHGEYLVALQRKQAELNGEGEYRAKSRKV